MNLNNCSWSDSTTPEIDILRSEMVKAYFNEGVTEEVLLLSRRLDQEIVDYLKKTF